MRSFTSLLWRHVFEHQAFLICSCEYASLCGHESGECLFANRGWRWRHCRFFRVLTQSVGEHLLFVALCPVPTVPNWFYFICSGIGMSVLLANTSLSKNEHWFITSEGNCCCQRDAGNSSYHIEVTYKHTLQVIIRSFHAGRCRHYFIRSIYRRRYFIDDLVIPLRVVRLKMISLSGNIAPPRLPIAVGTSLALCAWT